MMFKAVLYAYINNIYSCRKIEKSLLRDIHFIWLAGYEKPDYRTINRFRNRVKDEINGIFTHIVLILASKGFISLDVLNMLTAQKSNQKPTDTHLYGVRT